MKNSFTLLEIILSVLISSIVLIYTFGFTKELFTTNKNTQELEIKKVDFIATKIFLQKNAQNLKEDLSYKDKILYFKDSILLEEVEEFSMQEKNKQITIKINIANKIKQEWKFNHE